MAKSSPSTVRPVCRSHVSPKNFWYQNKFLDKSLISDISKLPRPALKGSKNIYLKKILRGLFEILAHSANFKVLSYKYLIFMRFSLVF
jgi:hypothetical protein